MTQTTEAHLWEIDHPYYAQEGNFYERGLHNRFESWDQFTETTFFDGDRDMNLLYRWDWNSWRRHPDPDLRSDSPDELLLFFILQRKAICCSASIKVSDEDEPRVRWFLEDCARALQETWAPIIANTSTAGLR